MERKFSSSSVAGMKMKENKWLLSLEPVVRTLEALKEVEFSDSLLSRRAARESHKSVPQLCCQLPTFKTCLM